jgi:hypothetical protein
MLEAVHAVLQSAPAVRPQAEQVSTAESFAANPDRVQKAPPLQAPYVSPYIFVDVALNKAVTQIRNGETGDVVGQFPTEASLRARASAAQQAEAPAPQAAALAREVDSAQAFVQNTAPPPVERGSTNVSSAAATAQQQAAFAAAARAGNSNAGTVTLFA